MQVDAVPTPCTRAAHGARQHGCHAGMPVLPTSHIFRTSSSFRSHPLAAARSRPLPPVTLTENRDSSMRVAVLTISDAGARGERADTSGDAAAEWAEWQGASVVARAIVPDDVVEIVRVLLAWCDDDYADLVLTTGGTGLSARDVTPEATRVVIEREAEGIAERLRVVTGVDFPRAALGRGLCGTRSRTLILNLPGSTNGVRETLAAFVPICKHAVDILRGAATDHSGAPRAPLSEYEP